MQLIYDTSTKPEQKVDPLLCGKGGAVAVCTKRRIAAKCRQRVVTARTYSNRTRNFASIIVDWFVTTLIKTPGHAPADPLACAAILNQLQMPGGVTKVTQQLIEAG